MNLYEQFKKLNIDFSAISMIQRNGNDTYFCTPKGAHIIGWAGIDGIHFCFIQGFDEMVFAVDPTGMPGDYVHPIARNFKDLIRLLLTCGGMAAIEQARLWSETEFYTFLKGNEITEEQVNVLSFLQTQFSILPMEQPYSYIKEVQQSFDYSQLKFPDKYSDMISPDEELIPEWKVVYDGGFWASKGKAAKTIPVGKTFTWKNASFFVSCVYTCSKGLIIDFCIAYDHNIQKSFLTNWGLQQLINMNGEPLKTGCGYFVWWNPKGLHKDISHIEEAKWILEHYGLDLSECWTIQRYCFPWLTSRVPVIKSLDLHLQQNPEDYTGRQNELNYIITLL